ncbi:hypothetical protein BRY75_10365 [Acinetobacter baumannii]|nr:hypothetical protein BRY75_10365 [Acinetobacter baumannii]
MCKANSFLLGVLPDIYRIMVAERKGVRGLALRFQHTQRCPPPVPPQRGHEGVHTKSIKPLMLLRDDPRRSTGNVGQQAKNSAQPFYSQAHKMPFVLN